MTPQQLSDTLNGQEYPLRLSKELRETSASAGLVIVYGESDDLIELNGAIYDEIGVWNGRKFRVDAKGLVPDFDQIDRDARNAKDKLRDYFARENSGQEIEALWDVDGYSWVIKTDIPHAIFDIMENGEKFCRGIVFRLSDVGNAP